MFSSTKNLVQSLLPVFILCAPGAHSARVKEFVGEKLATCVTPNTNNYLIQFPGPVNWTVESSKCNFYGNFTVTETIQEPLEFIVITNRCSMNMKTCELFNKLTLSRICSYINDEKGIWASFFKSMDPPFRCPVKPGVYKFNNSVVDLAFFTTFPLEGYRWQAFLKLYSKDKTKKEIFCLSTQISMKWVVKKG